MEKQIAQNILSALRGLEAYKAFQYIVADWAFFDQSGIAISPDISDEQWATMGWAEPTARDLGYEAANGVTDAMGLMAFSGPHGGDDARAILCRRIAWRFKEVVLEELEQIQKDAGWETRPPEE